MGLILAGFVWYGFSGSSQPTSLLTTQNAGGSSDSMEKDLVATLLALRSVSLSGTIFSDTTFRGLRDFSTQIVPEPMGRPDPFAPISGGSVSSETGGGNAKLFKSVSQ